ncbi:hypothetical protein [Streptomyces sp. CB02923]|uniref:hypothetical protein n=1 Tax=Streptomyces sp. CB02923 TaxID=1718985 RepID=UPI001901FBF7|nr:hypothetical protein [Streptomyces sp. CB02923]
MSALGWVALTLGSGCLGIRYGSATAWGSWGLLAAGVALVVAGVWAVLRGRQHLTPVLTSLQGLPADERVVLFLRAFSDDPGFSRVAALRWFRLLFTSLLPTPAHLRTEEDQVGRAVAPFGRMVALGRPSDRLPRLGAERSYASDETWRTEVLAALDRAALVLLVAGAGRSLAWEVDQVLGRDAPTRLVLVVSRDRNQYGQFRESLGDRFPNGLPDYPSARMRHRLLRGRYVRAAIWFDGDWTPHWEMLDGRFPLIGLARRTQRALPRALRTVYQRADVPARLTPTTPRPWAVKLSVPLIAAFWLIPLALPVLAVILADAVNAALSGPFGAPAGTGTDASGDSFAIGHNNVLDLLSTAWPMWLWMAVVAACGYRVWRGGPYVIMMARIQGVFVPVYLLAFILATLPAYARLAFVTSGLLVLVVLSMPVAAMLLIRRDVRDWVDSRL